MADDPEAAKPGHQLFFEERLSSNGKVSCATCHRPDRDFQDGTALAQGAVQQAKHFGAEVTAVCSAGNAGLVKSLGADHVIDYETEDFTRNGRVYDAIMDTAGSAPFARSRASLREGGRLLLVLGNLRDLVTIPWIALTNSRRVIGGTARGEAADLRLLAELAQAGKLTPVIGRRYRFDEIAEAHRYVDTGRKKGNVVITVEH